MSESTGGVPRAAGGRPSGDVPSLRPRGDRERAACQPAAGGGAPQGPETRRSRWEHTSLPAGAVPRRLCVRERPPRERADDPVGLKAPALLEALDRALRARAEDPVREPGLEAECLQPLLQAPDEPAPIALADCRGIVLDRLRRRRLGADGPPDGR